MELQINGLRSVIHHLRLAMGKKWHKRSNSCLTLIYLKGDYYVKEKMDSIYNKNTMKSTKSMPLNMHPLLVNQVSAKCNRLYNCISHIHINFTNPRSKTHISISLTGLHVPQPSVQRSCSGHSVFKFSNAHSGP